MNKNIVCLFTVVYSKKDISGRKMYFIVIAIMLLSEEKKYNKVVVLL